MADSSRPSWHVSRRALIGGLGAGLASLPLLWWLDVPERVRDRFGSERPDATMPTDYVDRDGWMLTPEDVPAYEASRQTP